MNNWQPIETAPKDRPILGFDGRDMTTVEWCYFDECWDLVVYGAHATDSEWYPTHWQPLPEPPEE